MNLRSHKETRKTQQMEAVQKETQEIDIREPLRVCLSKFSGADGRTLKKREDSLIQPFETLARKILYGGYLRVGDDYAIFVHTVEFYYHEEKRGGRCESRRQDCLPS